MLAADKLTCSRDALYMGMVKVMLIGPVSFFRFTAQHTNRSQGYSVALLLGLPNRKNVQLPSKERSHFPCVLAQDLRLCSDRKSESFRSQRFLA